MLIRASSEMLPGSSNLTEEQAVDAADEQGQFAAGQRNASARLMQRW